MEASKTNQTRWGMTPQHFHTIPTSCAICHHLHKYALCSLVVCREGLWKAVGWVVVGVYIVHLDVHGEWVMLWVAALYTEHGRYGLS